MTEESKALATLGMEKEIIVTKEQVAVIKNTIAKGATDDELKLFVHDCQRRGVHPMDRMIHFIVRGKGEFRTATHQASIDFLRSESENSGSYAGMDEPVFEGLKKFSYKGQEYEAPVVARVTVRRFIRQPDGQYAIVPFIGVARWKEYYPGDQLGFQWRKMPHHMLAKCAEAIARRIAWPKKFNNLYTPDEMAQADAQGRKPEPSTDFGEAVRPAGAATLNDAIDVTPASSEQFEKISTMMGKLSIMNSDEILDNVNSILGEGPDITDIYDLTSDQATVVIASCAEQLNKPKSAPAQAPAQKQRPAGSGPGQKPGPSDAECDICTKNIGCQVKPIPGMRSQCQGPYTGM